MNTRVRRPCLLAAAAVASVVAIAAGAAPAYAAPGPPSAPEYWFDTWHVPQLWDDGARGQGITIAEIDTGVNASLPELTANMVPGIDLGESGNGETDRSVDEFGHGTAMASIMVAQQGSFGITGLAPDAELMPIAVPLQGTTDASSNDHLAQAIRYAVDHGAKIISMSLGGVSKPGSTSEPCPSDEQQAIYYALRHGAVLVAAAGNSGRSGNAIEQPGVCLGVLAIGAVQRDGSVASFSSRHPYVTLDAPGVNIPSLSRVPGIAYHGNGTSQATAIASAVLALVWSRYPALTGSEVVARVVATLDEHRSTPDPAYGYGLLDAYTAVTADVPTTARNPVAVAVAPFLAKYAALQHSPHFAALPPAWHQHAALGRFAIAGATQARSVQPAVGIALAAAGLAALIGLVVLAVLRRRRFSASEPPG
jgi:subtilisin family serine protease